VFKELSWSCFLHLQLEQRQTWIDLVMMDLGPGLKETMDQGLGLKETTDQGLVLKEVMDPHHFQV